MNGAAISASIAAQNAITASNAAMVAARWHGAPLRALEIATVFGIVALAACLVGLIVLAAKPYRGSDG